MQALIVFSALLVVISATPYPLLWKPCGGSANISKVTGDPCSSSACQVKSGENITLKVTFTPIATVQNLTAEVTGKVGSFPPVNFPLPNPDACEGCGLACPLKGNQEVSYHNALQIPGGLPELIAVVTWKLSDGAERNIVCFEVEVQVN